MRVIEAPIGGLDKGARNRVKAIWSERFGDSAAFVEFFLNGAARGTKAVFAEIGGAIEGMTFLIPCEFVSNGSVTPIRYVYAMATTKPAEGKGIATALLDYANDGVPTVLVPADKKLVEFYAARGYVPNLSVKAELFDYVGGDVENIEIRDVSAAEYFELREKNMAGEFVKWGADAVKFAIDETLFFGGRAVIAADGSWAAIYKVFYGLVFVKEIVGRFDIKTVGRRLAQIEGADRFNLRYNGDEGEWKYFGMSRGIDVSNGYLNLALD